MADTVGIERRTVGHLLALGIALATLLVVCPFVFALDPTLDISQYAHTSWKVRDGFVKGFIYAIAQTPDGYLWLGTEFGLYRFDGVHAAPWRPPAAQQLPSNEVRNLVVTSDGALWIGTNRGLARWMDGKLTIYSELSGQAISGLFQDHEGTVWIGTNRLGSEPPRHDLKLCDYRDGAVQCFGVDPSGTLVMGFYEDSRQELWVGVGNGFWRWRPGPPQFFPIPGETGGVRSFAEDQLLLLISSSTRGVLRLVNGQVETYRLPGLSEPFSAYQILRDRDGSLWIGSRDRGLAHVQNGRADWFSEANGLSGDAVVRVSEDREGNIWVVTTSGLDKFRAFAVPNVSIKEGMSNAFAQSILASKDGTIWIATSNGLNRWKDGRVSLFMSRGARWHLGKINGLTPNSLFGDSSGRVWVSTTDELGYLEDDRFVPIRDFPGGFASSMAEAPKGHFWLTDSRAGLLHIYQGKTVEAVKWGL